MTKALVYDERRGSFSVGSHIRQGSPHQLSLHFLAGVKGGGCHVGLSQQKVRYGRPHVAEHGTPTKRPVTERPVFERPVFERPVTRRNRTFGNLDLW